MLSDKLLSFTQVNLLHRERFLRRLPEFEAARTSCRPEEQELLDFLLATLPVTDLGDYTPSLLLAAVRHGLRVREEFEWCAKLPEHIFLLYVLCPRVNNEQLSDCRELFYGELAKHVRRIGFTDAALEVNRWCAEHVTYRSTDIRTSSALDIYTRGYGRCGEESVFTVNALRSVGIPARQVYSPWWAHCDDNHAWVEVFDGWSWRYLGACEPEPRLDMGWFTNAAGRAMLCHAKAFVGNCGDAAECLFPGTEPMELDFRGGVAYESVTERYAKVNPFTVVVKDSTGPVPNAHVAYYILNYGGLCQIAERRTDESGCATLKLGRGSVWVTAWKSGRRAEALIDTTECEAIELNISAPQPVQNNFDFTAPTDGGIAAVQLTPEERCQRREILERARELRESRATVPLYPASAERILASLTPKDRDTLIDPQVLEESLVEDSQVQELYSPRIGNEPLMPWRQLLAQVLPGLPPSEIWNWLDANIDKLSSFTDLPQTPAGAWRLAAATQEGLGVLFCGICRARGVPARIGWDGAPEYQENGRWMPVDGAPRATLRLERPESGAVSLMRFTPNGWEHVPVSGPLPEGEYRLMSALRLPNGDQLGRYEDIKLSSDITLRVDVREAAGQGMLQKITLPELGFEHSGPCLLCWAEPREEPTEHLLGELREAWARLEALNCRVHMCCEAPEKLSFRPESMVVHRLDDDVAEAVARKMYLEPGRLPLAVLTDAQGRGRYACAGYNVGSVELMASILEKLL